MSNHKEEAEITKNYIRLSQFYAAICEHSNEKYAIVEGILDREGDINYKICPNSFFKYRRPHFLGYTALHFALDEREGKIFDILIKRGADFTIKNDNGATVLHQAVESSYHKFKRCWKLKGKLWHPFVDSVLSAHINYRVTSNPYNKNGMSHFHIACMANNAKAVEFFLQNGALVNEAVHSDSLALPGYTPLHFAARYCSLETAEVLLRYGADPKLKDAKEMSPLHILIDRNMEIIDWMKTAKRANFGRFMLDIQDNEKMINLILSKQDSSSVSDVIEDTGISRLHIACTMQDTSSVERMLQRDVDLEHFVNTDSPVWPGYTALHFAAHFNFKAVRLLLARGANILAQDTKGVTPFDLCLQRYKAEDIYLLVMSQPFWRQVTFSDGTTRLSDLVFAMRYSSSMNHFLRQMDDKVNMCIPFDSPMWPGYTALHLAVIFPERTNDIAELIEDTDYKVRDSVPTVYNCSDDDERVYFERIKVCLSLGADVTAQDARGLTPIHLAFRLQKEKVVEYLLDFQRKMINPVDDDGLSHFHIACATRKQSLVENLLCSGVDVNSPVMSSFKWFGIPYYKETRPYVFYISTGSTPLHIAVASESPELTDTLVRHGADLYATDANGLTPIHRVLTTRARKETGGYLTSSSNLKDCTVRGGLSHLHIASFVNNSAAVSRLLERGSNLEATVTYRLPPDSSSLNEGPEFRDVFVDPYDDRSLEPLAFLAPYSGYTPLHFAMQEHCRETIKQLLERGANILAKKANGSTPLYATLDCPFTDTANLFSRILRSDLDIQRRMEEDIGLTMLHIDCVNLNVSEVARRLRAGADPNARVNADSSVWPGCTPLHVLMSKSHDDTDSRSVIKVVKLLLQHGADVTLMNEDQVTPVHEAYSLFDLYGHLYVDILLTGHRDFSVNPHSVRGMSHFHVACIRNNVAAVEKFLEHGVDVDQAIDHFSNTLGGYSSLHLAMVHGSSPTVALLLKHGANVLVEDRVGNTPLHAAAEHNSSSKELIEKIISAGADINARNILGETPFETLLSSNEAPEHIVQLFLNYGCKVNVFNPISQEGYIAMAFCMNIGNVCAVQKPAFRAVLKAADVTDLDEMGRNAIHNMVSTSKKINSADDYADGIKLLSRMGCDFDHQDNRGRTPLHLAAQFRNFHAIAGLLMSGADVNILDANGRPAFAYSLERSEDRRERDLYIIVTFHMHLRKLQLLELDIDKLNIETDIEARKKFPFNVDVVDRCREEMQRLKERKIDPYSITLFDFLSETGAVAAYPHMTQVERHAVDEFFYNDNSLLRSEFPELAYILKLQYRKAVSRVPLMEPAAYALMIALRFELPVLCSDAVLRFLKNQELINLIAASETMSETRKRLRT